MYTTSSVFLQSLANAGVSHVFANWGSDHPALLEDLQRQRAEGDGKTTCKIITCPNEMVALTAAQGFAQVTGKPAAVIVHVDVGTIVRRFNKHTPEFMELTGYGWRDPQRRPRPRPSFHLRWRFAF